MYYNDNNKMKLYILIGVIAVVVIIAVIVVMLFLNKDNTLSPEILSHNALMESYAIPEGKGAIIYSLINDIAEYNSTVTNTDLIVKVKIKNNITDDDSKAIDLLSPPLYTKLFNTNSIISVGRYMGTAVYSDKGYVTMIMYTKR